VSVIKKKKVNKNDPERTQILELQVRTLKKLLKIFSRAERKRWSYWANE
jgi:hypothetical protein